MNSTTYRFFLYITLSAPLHAAAPGEAPVPAPYPDTLDIAATNKWWEYAKQARDGKVGNKKHPKGSVTATGRHFLNLDVPRNEVIAFALYTVHDRTLKLSAQLYPLYPDESRKVRIEFQKNGEWEEAAEATVNDLGWSALFRIEDWDDSSDVPYRVRHGKKAVYEGIIRGVPKGDTIVIASLSCNSSKDRGPRPDIIRNLKAVDPDLLFFAGDQHYDHTEHTAGWLLWGYQFREVTRDRPTITIPDDHDVGQGNIWGEGGIPTEGKGAAGGYIHDPDYVKQVERCQTAHLPDPYDPTPIAQGIGVYYTSYNLGGVDFAIIEDRKFKSGPAGKIPDRGGRADHVKDMNYDTSTLDIPGLKLLGDRQLNFLNNWAQQWDGVQMKAVLSQTPFYGGAHIHSGKRLKADLDSNGWPQTGRRKAVSAIRKGFAVHIAGDQHLATLAQHGIDEFRDGPWSLISPSIVGAVYVRMWHPADEKPGANPPPDSPLPWTGDYLDGLGNRLSMHAYATPQNGMKAHGFVIARFNKKDRTITAECWPRYTDMTQADAVQLMGWPKVITQLENYSPPSWGKLGELSFNKSNPVVQLIDSKSKDVLYTLRVRGKTFTPHAPKDRSFTIKAGMKSPDKVIVKAASTDSAKAQQVKL